MRGAQPTGVSDPISVFLARLYRILMDTPAGRSIATSLGSIPLGEENTGSGQRTGTVGAANKHRQIGFLKEAGVDPNEYKNPQRMDQLVRGGVIYKDKKKKYWVDAHGRDCFAIYARGLNIDGSDSSEYWQWTPDRDGIDVAEVVNVKWLGVRGSFWTMNLSHEGQYNVSFHVKMANPSSTMAGKMVQLKLILPNGDCQQTQKPLPTFSPPGHHRWKELEVGRFTMSTQNVGEMKVIMENEFDDWKKGLVIRSVEIKTT